MKRKSSTATKIGEKSKKKSIKDTVWWQCANLTYGNLGNSQFFVDSETFMQDRTAWNC